MLHYLFQFLIGKVQQRRLWSLTWRSWKVFQFLIGKVQPTAKKSIYESRKSVSIPHR